VANDKVKRHFKGQLMATSGMLKADSKPEDFAANSGHLLEAALNLSRCETNPGERVAAFAALVAELAGAWPSLGQRVRAIIQEMCEDLPLEQTGEMWRLNLRLRSQ
jgi:hypothetical protein